MSYKASRSACNFICYHNYQYFSLPVNLEQKGKKEKRAVLNIEYYFRSTPLQLPVPPLLLCASARPP